MGLLSAEKIGEIYTKAVEDGLYLKRSVLLAGLAPAYLASLEMSPAPAGQLLLDLNGMNQTPRIIGDVTPLHHWLMNASFLSAAFPDRQRFYGDLADEAARRADEGRAPAVGGGGGEPPAGPTDLLPERIIFKNDLVPASFVAGAARTSLSIARVVVPQYDGGMPRLNPSTGQQGVGYGTGWLIGKGYLITNWHVVVARAPGEPAPAIEDIRRQCQGTQAEFDYDSIDMVPNTVAVAELAHGDPALDYAILKLASAPDRPTLPLQRESLVVDEGSPFPVNVIQHPGAAPKQFGIRNNLVAALRGNDLAYYTDTAGGSSGAPVCDDRWNVIALHKASTLSFGKLNFQGKDTVWVNVGTPIHLIVADLGEKKPDLWTEMAANLV
ncbi:MAG TPA: trypsin-like peptidase domain-containing protein [Allosphingosinicella sp.]|jgi:hypothetical protein